MNCQKKYVLTGAPGSGKSSILLSLEQKDEHIIREAAEDYIKLKQSQGVFEPWLDESFQENILELQLRREARVPEYAKRVFIDRGILDGQAYLGKNFATYQRIESLADKVKYDGVFMIDPLRTTETNGFRRENRDEAQRLAERLYNIYQKHGYNIEIVPADNLNDRVDQILKTLESYKK